MWQTLSTGKKAFVVVGSVGLCVWAVAAIVAIVRMNKKAKRIHAVVSTPVEREMVEPNLQKAGPVERTKNPL